MQAVYSGETNYSFIEIIIIILNNTLSRWPFGDKASRE